MKTQHCITNDVEFPVCEPIASIPLPRTTPDPAPRRLGNVIAWRMEPVDALNPHASDNCHQMKFERHADE